MSEEKNIVDNEPKAKKPKSFFKLLISVVIIAVIIHFAATKPKVAMDLLKVLIGFGAVIMIHEFGHFLVAKLGGIKVEAFSIGFPPTLLGLRRTEDGYKIRFLPGSAKNKEDEPDSDEDSQPAAGVKKYKAWDTEYRVGLVPFGGFVKMLGQEDVGSAQACNDPRSFVNKPIWIRIAVVAAGVIFNAISAVLLFMIIFMLGMPLPAAQVGTVMPGSPAEIAGIKPADKIIEINGEDFIDFTNLNMASALAQKGKPISLVVEHIDGTKENINVVPEIPANGANGLRSIGITQSETLRIDPDISKVPEAAKMLYENMGLAPGDVVKAFNRVPLRDWWHLHELVTDSLEASAVLTVERTNPETKEKYLVDVELPLVILADNGNFKDPYDIAQVYGIVPRLKVLAAAPKPSMKTYAKKISEWFGKTFLKKEPVPDTEPQLEPDDIIIKIADTENPIYKQLREITTDHKDKELTITVLRINEQQQSEQVDIVVHPTRTSNERQVTIGFVPILDFEHPVVAATIDVRNGPSTLPIPSGAVIEKVDGQEVNSFYDVVRIMRNCTGQRINIDYRIDRENAGAIGLTVPKDTEYIHASTMFKDSVPFEYLMQNFKTSNPATAIRWGSKKCFTSIVHTFDTLRRLIGGDIGPKTLTGPVGIVSISYRFAKEDTRQYVYFLALISSIIAVMNLLPLPIVDGGVIVLLIVEKIKGSPLNQRTQEVIAYAGLVLIVSLFVWLTFNDLRNLLFL